MTRTVSPFRRLAGVLLMIAGAAMLTWSACPTVLAIADYFSIAELWGTTCPDSFWTKLYIIGGVVVAVVGQRLYSGRNLRTGEKAEAADS